MWQGSVGRPDWCSGPPGWFVFFSKPCTKLTNCAQDQTWNQNKTHKKSCSSNATLMTHLTVGWEKLLIYLASTGHGDLPHTGSPSSKSAWFKRLINTRTDCTTEYEALLTFICSPWDSVILLTLFRKTEENLLKPLLMENTAVCPLRERGNVSQGTLRQCCRPPGRLTQGHKAVVSHSSKCCMSHSPGTRLSHPPGEACWPTDWWERAEDSKPGAE